MLAEEAEVLRKKRVILRRILMIFLPVFRRTARRSMRLRRALHAGHPVEDEKKKHRRKKDGFHRCWSISKTKAPSPKPT